MTTVIESKEKEKEALLEDLTEEDIGYQGKQDKIGMIMK
jgi:hypothetical protein